MPTQVDWRGDAPAVAQETKYLPPGQDGEVVFKIGSRSLGPFRWSRTGTGSTAAIVTAWNNTRLAEFSQITASLDTHLVFDAGAATSVTIPALLLKAKVAGTPFEVTVELDGQEYTSEIQKLGILNSPTGGTWTITFNGQTTSGIAHNASAATVQAALEALSNIAPGDVTVTRTDEAWTESGGALIPTYTVAFGGAYQFLNLPQMTVSDAGLTGGNLTIDVTTLVNGQTPVNEVQRLTMIGNPTEGTFTVTIEGLPTVTLNYNASASAAQAAFDAAIGAGKVTVSGGPLPGTPLDLTFVGPLRAQNLALVTVNASALTGTSASLTLATPTAGVAGTNAKYRFKLSANPAVPDGSGRTAFNYHMFITLGAGQDWYSAPIAYTATAAEVQAALENMTLYFQGGTSNPAFLGAGNVTVSGSLQGTWPGGSGTYLEVEFIGHWHSTPISLTATESSSQRGTNNSIPALQKTTVSAGLAGTNKVQTITQAGTPTGNFLSLIHI